ncbi:MAG TPA: MFS transporter [Spirochaetales bacterium]|jgi:MFS family permease|nr:MFS transporter [Spirochaetales bacterium]
MKRARVYPYRWVVLVALMGVIMVSQMQWLVLAPVARAATKFYEGQASSTAIDLLTLIFLLGFIVFSLPASYIIDKLGLKWTLRLASLLLAFFSLLKGIFSTIFPLVLVSQIALAIAYALILSSVTLVTSRWFALSERGFATGLVSLAQYLGLILVMVVSPLVVKTHPQKLNYGEGVRPLLFYLGIVSAAVAIAMFFLFKENPPTPPSKEEVVHESPIPTVKLFFEKKSLLGFSLIFGLVWGLFNAFIAKIDSLAAFMGVENSNGIAGLILLGGGMVGSIVVPYLSDFFRKRKFFFFISLAGIFVCCLIFAFMPIFSKTTMRTYILGYIVAGFLGFFFQSAIPLGFQYASELSYPIKESSSQAILLMGGHMIGALLLFLMLLKEGALLSLILIVSVVLLGIATAALLFVEESPLIVTEEERFAGALEETIKGE